MNMNDVYGYEYVGLVIDILIMIGHKYNICDKMCKRSTTQARRKLYSRLGRVPGRMIEFAGRPSIIICRQQHSYLLIMLDCKL